MELTKQEAIELLKERYMTMSMCADKDYCIKQNAAIDMAISALREDSVTEEANNLIMQQKKEIERLNFDLQIMRGAANSLKMHYNTAKAEGIKEFADRLKDELRLDDDCDYYCYDCCYACRDYVPFVDKLVKYMIKETKSEDAGKRIYDDFMKSCKL